MFEVSPPSQKNGESSVCESPKKQTKGASQLYPERWILSISIIRQNRPLEQPSKPSTRGEKNQQIGIIGVTKLH